MKERRNEGKRTRRLWVCQGKVLDVISLPARHRSEDVLAKMTK